MKKTPTIAKFTWTIVLGAALVMSAWSLYYVARHAGMPVFAAVLTSTVFDGAALLCGDYALKFARVGESGIGPRMGMYLFAGASAYLNSMHAAIAHQSSFYRVLWALPPIVAVVIYEFHTRWERRNVLAKSHRKLPAYGLITWALHPIRTFVTIRAVSTVQAIRITRLAIPAPNTQVSETQDMSNGEFAGSISEFPTSSGDFLTGGSEFIPIDYAAARVWAREHDYMVGDRGTLPAYVIDAYRAYLKSEENEEGSA